MRLGKIIRSWRVNQDLGIREVAAQIGISAATLSRIERGEKMDGRTLAAILHWLAGPV